METLRIDIQSEQEKKVLLAFLDSLHYQYRTENDDYAPDNDDVKDILKRKDDYLKGNTTAKTWSEIKKRFEGI